MSSERIITVKEYIMLKGRLCQIVINLKNPIRNSKSWTEQIRGPGNMRKGVKWQPVFANHIIIKTMEC